MAVSKRLRFEILRRDGHTCRYCGASAPEVKLAVDHVTPVALGGTDDPSNLATACVDCNSGKSATPPDAATVAEVEQNAAVWAAAMDAAADARAASESQRRQRDRLFEDEWNEHRPHQFRSTSLPVGWPASLDQLSRAGLSDRDMLEMIPTAMSSRAGDKWRYFCGCCWTLVRELQDAALEIVNSAEGNRE